MTCSGCIGFGSRVLVAVSSRCSTSSAARDVAAIDRVREVEAARGADVAEVPLDRRRRRASRRSPYVDASTSTSSGHAARVVAEVRDETLRARPARGGCPPP